MCGKLQEENPIGKLYEDCSQVFQPSLAEGKGEGPGGTFHRLYAVLTILRNPGLMTIADLIHEKYEENLVSENWNLLCAHFLLIHVFGTENQEPYFLGSNLKSTTSLLCDQRGKRTGASRGGVRKEVQGRGCLTEAPHGSQPPRCTAGEGSCPEQEGTWSSPDLRDSKKSAGKQRAAVWGWAVCETPAQENVCDGEHRPNLAA
ncbi:uncharacterized protein LOC106506202 isoform X3 [Sus scrofa]|uniref:uncharacterized protein LOC106506202 isoform X3 n=1 Tax=Sus scrofa TaxID=9823 RepID=UPI000A2B7A0F|nr:uncharacterized protein LOC106506202 isoform X3 [Sus scrofa]